MKPLFKRSSLPTTSANMHTNTAAIRKGPSSRWGRKITLVILALALLMWGWQKISAPNTFPIRTVKIIDNQRHIDHLLLQHIITPYLPQGMLWLKTQDLQNTLLQIPWINQAAIQREWPHQLIIHLTEQTPIAHWNNAQLINRQLETFDPGSSPAKRNLPWLDGPDNQQAMVWEGYEQLNHMLLPLGLSIVHLALTSEESWEIQLNNGLRLMLGHDDVPVRLGRFVYAYPALFSDKVQNISYVDLRYSNGFAVKWK